MELLWGMRKQPTRGPAPGLSVEQIVQTAIEIADTDGLGALSMRRVAERLGVSVMSLYTYIPGKVELLDVMLDTILGEEAILEDQTEDWRGKLEQRAREDWALYQRHQWVLQISTARSLLGPNETALFDATLHAVSEIGLTGNEMISIVSLVTGYVRGAAQSVLEATLAAQRTGMTDDEWWAVRGPLLDKYFDPDRYPTVTKMHLSGAFDQPYESPNYTLPRALSDFEFGLQRVLDGIEAYIQQRSAQPDEQ
jgi:AcrR family transcriptional regulator